MKQICIIFFYFININSISQTIESKTDTSSAINVPNLNNNYQKNDVTHYFLKLGVGLSASAVSLIIDDEIRDLFNADKKLNNNSLLKIGHTYGDFYYNIYFSGALILSQFITDNHEFARTGKALFESIVVGSLFSISLKYIFGRSRPYKREGNFKFNWFESENINNSLPSGHVITAFTTSTILSKWIDNDFASVFLYGLAGLTAYQRIETDNHWFSDILLGASIGYLTAEYFYNQNQIESCGNKSYYVIPFFSHYSSGVTLSYSF